MKCEKDDSNLTDFMVIDLIYIIYNELIFHIDPLKSD